MMTNKEHNTYNKVQGTALRALLGACAAVLLGSCADEFDNSMQVSKPESVANAEHLAQFDVLKSYAGSLPLAVTMEPAEFLKKEIAYSTVLANLGGIDINGAYTPVNTVNEAGYNFGGMQAVANAASEAGVTLYGGTLVSSQNQRAGYLNKLMEPIVIPFVPQKGKTVLVNFDNDALGTAYGMTGGSQAVVESDPDGKSGHALHVGTNEVKAAYSHPKFNVQLPEGRKLGDYVRLNVDMRIVNNDGLWGSGMRVFINGQEFTVGTNAQGFGCSPNQWLRGGVIRLDGSGTPGLNLPEDLKQLTRFELAVGSASGGAQFYLDNISMDYEVAAAGTTDIGFEKDGEGTSYPMTNGSTATVVQDPAGKYGKVLQVGTADKKAAQSFPTFKVKLEPGRTLKDYTQLSMDMYVMDGGWGQGIKVFINGHEFNCGKGPFAFGCQANQWSSAISVKFLADGNSGDGNIVIPAELRNLTEFDLAVGSASGAWYAYVDNIRLHWKADDTIIPKTDEEKAALMTAEMKKWTGGILGAGGATVKAWNIIGEPLSTNADGNTFNWAGILGTEGYARTAIQLARDTAATELDLFVSQTFDAGDDLAAKADELIALVGSWEADGKTRIDGYNILLHATTALPREAVSTLLSKLGQTGKHVRLSDLSIAVAGDDGKALPTNQLTDGQRSEAIGLMAYILQQYRQLVPAGQQYGLSFATLTEGGTTLSPWTAGWNRNTMYEGVVNGLK